MTEPVPHAPEDEDAIRKLVDRFLGWRLPKDFSPDCGISFKPSDHPNQWPVGTNLFTADQAQQMFEYVLQDSLACPRPLVMGEHACRNRKQCWEPCGDLGHHEEYARTAPSERGTSGASKDDLLRAAELLQDEHPGIASRLRPAAAAPSAIGASITDNDRRWRHLEHGCQWVSWTETNGETHSFDPRNVGTGYQGDLQSMRATADEQLKRQVAKLKSATSDGVSVANLGQKLRDAGYAEVPDTGRKPR